MVRRIVNENTNILQLADAFADLEFFARMGVTGDQVTVFSAIGQNSQTRSAEFAQGTIPSTLYRVDIKVPAEHLSTYRENGFSLIDDVAPTAASINITGLPFRMKTPRFLGIEICDQNASCVIFKFVANLDIPPEMVPPEAYPSAASMDDYSRRMDAQRERDGNNGNQGGGGGLSGFLQNMGVGNDGDDSNTSGGSQSNIGPYAQNNGFFVSEDDPYFDMTDELVVAMSSNQLIRTVFGYNESNMRAQSRIFTFGNRTLTKFFPVPYGTQVLINESSLINVGNAVDNIVSDLLGQYNINVRMDTEIFGHIFPKNERTFPFAVGYNFRTSK